MIKGKFYLDSRGYPRADYQSPEEVLGWYLEQDIQGSAKACDELLRVCDELVEGKRSDWEGVGNAHTVSITDGIVTIENEFSDTAQSCTVSVEDFRTAIKSWKDLLGTVPN